MWYKFLKLSQRVDYGNNTFSQNGTLYVGDPNKKMPELTPERLQAQIKENQNMIFQNPQQNETQEQANNQGSFKDQAVQQTLKTPGNQYNYNTFKMMQSYDKISDQTSMEIINNALSRSKSSGDGWKTLNDQITSKQNILPAKQIENIRKDFAEKFKNVSPPMNSEDAKIKNNPPS